MHFASHHSLFLVLPFYYRILPSISTPARFLRFILYYLLLITCFQLNDLLSFFSSLSQPNNIIYSILSSIHDVFRRSTYSKILDTFLCYNVNLLNFNLLLQFLSFSFQVYWIYLFSFVYIILSHRLLFIPRRIANPTSFFPQLADSFLPLFFLESITSIP